MEQTTGRQVGGQGAGLRPAPRPRQYSSRASTQEPPIVWAQEIVYVNLRYPRPRPR